MKTAFIGLDYIMDITHPSGKIAAAAKQVSERNIIAHANQVLAHARSQNWLIVQVKVGFGPGYQNHPARSPFFGPIRQLNALQLGSSGTDFHPDLDVRVEDLVVIKHRVSPFYATDLEAALRAQKIERVVLAGVSTCWAVQAAARDAHDRDYEVVIVEDACAAADSAAHDASLALLSHVARLIKTAEISSL
ncbi:cysteine hydrolase [Neisseriaceae bacterium TC5R-5]|nr:cysteine hydrolase [Neisseriaceae bacterium TC5R-5]